MFDHLLVLVDELFLPLALVCARIGALCCQSLLTLRKVERLQPVELVDALHYGSSFFKATARDEEFRAFAHTAQNEEERKVAENRRH